MFLDILAMMVFTYFYREKIMSLFNYFVFPLMICFVFISIIMTVIDDKTRSLYRELRKIDVILKNKSEDKKESARKEPQEKVFDKGQNYDVYKAIKNIVKEAKNEVFIVDAYPDHTIFELYIDEIPNGVQIKILSKEPKGKFVEVATLFSKNLSKKIEIKSNKIHDRLLFVDDSAWVIGASIKDAGNQPTYLIKMEDKELQYSIYSKLFNEGKSLLQT